MSFSNIVHNPTGFECVENFVACHLIILNIPADVRVTHFLLPASHVTEVHVAVLAGRLCECRKYNKHFMQISY